MGNNSIIPTAFEVSRHEAGEMIKVRFDDDQANSCSVLLGRANLPLLISELQRVAPEPRIEMRPEDIALGKVLALRGIKVGPGKTAGYGWCFRLKWIRTKELIFQCSSQP